MSAGWLIFSCLVGCVIQHWRSLAVHGFGLGELNAPPIVASSLGHLVVFAIGFALKWGSAAALYRIGGLTVAIAVLLVGTILARVAVRRFLARSEIENATLVQGRIDKGEL